MPGRFAQLDDTRLAHRVAAGDVAAFETLYDRHHRALLSFCRHMLGSTEDGEDALQQTFLRAHGALRGGQVPDAIRPWLFAIARNRCLSMLSARRAVARAARGRRALLRRPGRRTSSCAATCASWSPTSAASPRTSAPRSCSSSSAACRRPRSASRDRRPRGQGQGPRLPGAHRADGRARRPLHPLRHDPRGALGRARRCAAPRSRCAATSSTASPARPTAPRSRPSARASPRSSPSPRPSASRRPCWPPRRARAR